MLHFDPSQEGACLLYDGVRETALLGQNPLKRVHHPPRAGKKSVIGYLAYPNPTLKNDIPDSLFYEYESLMSSSRKRGPVLDSRLHGNDYKTSGRLEQSVTKAQYIKKIHQIKELLAAGEVYQINYAIRFRKKFKGDPYTLFLRLAQINPAAFSAYLNCGDFQIVSASPERLFKIKNGLITTQPIKGTTPKSGGRKSLERLLASEKERAELDMITDLERNDIGKICEHGTVKLKKERAIMELPNMWHTYSEVQGRLRRDVRLPQVFDALFPGGSVTGCPKLRAMEYIEKLEGLPRNIFTGSIGYVTSVSFPRHRLAGPRPGGGKRESALKADFNIAIRTALIHKGYIEYWAGGGIVFDSDPEREYQECMLKAEKFLALL